MARYRSRTTGRFVKATYARRYPGRVHEVVFRTVAELEAEEEGFEDELEDWEIEVAIDYEDPRRTRGRKRR